MLRLNKRPSMEDPYKCKKHPSIHKFIVVILIGDSGVGKSALL